MQYLKIAKTTDFKKRKIKSYKLIGKHVAIIKEPDGSFYAIEATCKHQNADLTTGRIKGSSVTCPRHGWQYDLRSGKCLNHDSAPLRRYGLKVEGEDIFVSITPVEAY